MLLYSIFRLNINISLTSPYSMLYYSLYGFRSALYVYHSWLFKKAYGFTGTLGHTVRYGTHRSYLSHPGPISH